MTEQPCHTDVNVHHCGACADLHRRAHQQAATPTIPDELRRVAGLIDKMADSWSLNTTRDEGWVGAHRSIADLLRKRADSCAREAG